MDIAIVGGLVRVVQGLAEATPTLIVGLFITAILRYYLGRSGTHKLFGGSSLRSLPQAWLVGMLLPVCSIGVIPIIREMRRVGIRPGAITAFALSAPLFNPLSLLYGLTLSRPMVIVGFAGASLAVVTILGLIWDRITHWEHKEDVQEFNVIGVQRLVHSLVFASRELVGPTGKLTLIALVGLFLLGALLPHGALQSSIEQLDPWAPLRMALVAVPIYATPMLTMSQLGMMFVHGNSPGAAFVLLLLGTGINLATLWWTIKNFGLRQTMVWFCVLFVGVVGLGYAVERPLIPPGVAAAGHTHAFDIYTNPLHSSTEISISAISALLEKSIGVFEYAALAMLAVIALIGGATHLWIRNWQEPQAESISGLEAEGKYHGWNRRVSPRTVGLTCLIGLVAFSVVACYAYYPPPQEVLEEMRLARVEILSAAISRDYERVLRFIPIVEDWSRKLEVGSAMRRFELRPYQQAQAQLLRKKLELLEHATEHAREIQREVQKELAEGQSESDRAERKAQLAAEHAEMDDIRPQLSATSRRLASAFE